MGAQCAIEPCMEALLSVCAYRPRKGKRELLDKRQDCSRNLMYRNKRRYLTDVRWLAKRREKCRSEGSARMMLRKVSWRPRGTYSR